MMVATGLPIAAPASPAAPAVTTDAQAATASTDGGFLGTLMQLLGLTESGPSLNAGVAMPVVAEESGEPDRGAAESTDAVLAPLLFVPATLPIVQPAEIRAAQLLARQSAESPAETLEGGVGGGVADALAAAARSDTGSQLLSFLESAVADRQPGAPAVSATHSLPAGILQTQGPETVASRAQLADAPIPRQLQAHVGTAAWSDELGATLHLLADKGHSAASLRLSPEHLGPLEVQISVQDNEATVWFGASNSDTRAALEQALPRLRELFAAQGLSLAQSGVFREAPREGSQRPGSPSARGDSADAASSQEVATVISRRGLVDLYA